ncbi:hypothetical protein CLU96_4716 [Chryseobacterium sp. 52]|uniref:hypothetical protein n=1 Tax=Chryseobacterium sp. 52 TaxID=2035213 RepID=UPI000C174A55|nr:hypothetical protein [Chryseobacterium sp. 52]PIF47649.1 hypothetical protein CLU96_4716 [Chryseobacterium sp. 52]
MDNFILLPKPYLNRTIPSEKVLIDQKINAELSRVRKLLPPEKADIEVRHDLGIKDLKAEEATKPIQISNFPLKGELLPIMEINKVITKRTADNLVNKSKKVTSDSISNDPNGNFSIGYICPLAFTSKLDYERIWGLVISTFFWYLVPPDNAGNYLIDKNGILLGMYSKDKNVLTTTETVKWHWDHDLYNKLSFPTVKFKIGVHRFDNGMPGNIVFSDEINVTFGSTPCINIHSTNVSASHSDGGYPSIKGGDHGTEPTISVHLNAPAPPGGQKVSLSVTGVGDTNPSAWITSGNEHVVIAGGQTYGQWSGIIGSRKVMTTKDIHIVAGVNGGESVSTLRITKK